jgi:hypothetical protein
MAIWQRLDRRKIPWDFAVLRRVEEQGQVYDFGFLGR